MNVLTPIKRKISAKEVERRREDVRQAQASSRLEGGVRSPESDHVFDAYIRGDIDATDIVPRLKALALT